MSQLSAKKQLTQRCCCCGIAIKQEEVDGEIMGTFVDYGAHNSGEITIKFCSECFEKIKSAINMDQGEAIMRRLELDNLKEQRDYKQLCYDHVVDEFLSENPYGLDATDEVGNGI